MLVRIYQSNPKKQKNTISEDENLIRGHGDISCNLPSELLEMKDGTRLCKLCRGSAVAIAELVLSE